MQLQCIKKKPRIGDLDMGQIDWGSPIAMSGVSDRV